MRNKSMRREGVKRNAKQVDESESLPGQVDESESEAPTRAPSPAPSGGPMPLEDEGMHVRWEEVLAGRDASQLGLEEVRELFKVGTPLKHRHALWSHRFVAPDSGSVEELQHAAIEADDAATIEADVARTQLTAWNRAALRRVLRAYAAANPDVGYCQGMNNIVAVFLRLGFDESMALRGCSSLLQGCCPGYHSRDLGGFRLDARVLEELARRLLPAEALRSLEALDIPLEVLASEHFLTLASRSWPLEVTARLWDLIFLEGSPVVFASFLALLNLYLPQALSVKKDSLAWEDDLMEEPVDTFRQNVLHGVSSDPGQLFHQIQEFCLKVPQSSIDALRLELAGKK